jgi:uncharacterized protein YjeT (DUF2065 family)
VARLRPLHLASECRRVVDWLLGALALMLILEGLLPFVRPALWRRVFESALQMSDGQLRFIGLASVLAGVLLLLFLRS